MSGTAGYSYDGQFWEPCSTKPFPDLMLEMESPGMEVCGWRGVKLPVAIVRYPIVMMEKRGEMRRGQAKFQR